ncbi:uncharacterized protein PpBr36_10258 [Pyricularia pennisetigena]|uniref:uncharacterized protein n=1 Tax=Pyricularia pennisetigena TaxID=1578925 RepID=UPI001151478B|nr:uncharacterized protein PpBr36_10258 [Pyricularia pennisetigena]TLS21473.1 hypothetical protein PpBr36_10258 [Pyricularia pennisetigena]
MFFTSSILFGLIRLAIAANDDLNFANYDTPDRGFLYQPQITHNWGHLSPFYSVPSDINPSSDLPGCTVTFAQSLSRHGARYPRLDQEYGAMIDRIQSSVVEYGRGYEFLRDYKHNVLKGNLNSLGHHESINAGKHFYRRYHNLARNNDPFIRYDASERVVESGVGWAQGFHLAALADKTRVVPDSFPYKTLKMPSGKGLNNTLGRKECPKDIYSKSKTTVDKFQAKFLTGIADRLNRNLPGANLSVKDAFDLMDLCTMETAATVLKTGVLSPVCGLFEEKDWKVFNQYHNAVKWHTCSYGNPFGPTLGVGWVNELIARLLQKPVVDHTSTNRTLTSNPATFPLKNKLYADFTHATSFLTIYSALGLLGSTPTPVPTNRVVSAVSPFAARMYVEKMTCSGQREELVRILVNHRVMRLPNCGADAEGRCKLSAFVESLSFARSGGHWDKCY